MENEIVLYDDWDLCEEDPEQHFWDYSELLNNLRRLARRFYGVVVSGTVGTWFSTASPAGHICETVDEALSGCLADCDFVRFSESNGLLHLYGWHHDGVNHFTLKFVTYEGCEYLDSGFPGTEEELVDELMDSPTLSSLPYLSEHVVPLGA